MAYMATQQFAGFGAFDLRARRFRPKRWLRHMMPMSRVASKTGVPLMPYGTAKDMVAFSASRPMMQPSKQVVMKDTGPRIGPVQREYISPRRRWRRPVHSNLFHRRGRRRKFLAPGIPGRFDPVPKSYAIARAKKAYAKAQARGA